MEQDLAAICELADDLASTHSAAWPLVFAPASGGNRDEWHWRQSIAGDRCGAFVAEDDNAVVGFITMRLVREVHSLLQTTTFAVVNSVCVQPKRRGQGIGRRLMHAAENWATGCGASDLRLTVWTFNCRAVKTYRELGCEVRSYNMGKFLTREGGDIQAVGGLVDIFDTQVRSASALQTTTPVPVGLFRRGDQLAQPRILSTRQARMCTFSRKTGRSKLNLNSAVFEHLAN